jgi:DNA helicase-2/ATP-dependent DNA helicase PcrA
VVNDRVVNANAAPAAAANSPDGLLAGLDDQQRQAAQALLGPVVLLAGAGTGKTRAITHRIAYGVATGVYSPSRVMALTFTARAAGELRSRLRSLGAGGVSARTFHASALSQLGFFWPQVVGGTAPKLLESKGRMIGHAAESLRLKLDTATLRDTASEIEWRKVSRLSLEQYAAAGRALPPSLSVEKIVDLQRAYETVKDERRQMDFEDVLLVTAGMIESEPRVAQQVREQYRFFVVDEYQDVSPLQQELLSLWLGERNDVCVVGDASQTIYTFAGASPDYLLGFSSAYDDATVVRLEQNYRSTAAIVDAANRVMRGRAGALELHAVAGAPAGPAPVVSEFPNDRAEARSITDSIRTELDGGTAPASIAILYRINVQSAVLESALRDANVPFVIRGATRFFDQREVKEAIMLLKGASVNTRPEPLFQTVSDVLRSLGWTQDAPTAQGAVRERWDSLNALMGLADEAPPETDLKEFVAELLERQSGQHEPTMSAVTLATLHSAKGLEWDTVYIVGASEGLLPIMYAKTEPSVDEERRLFYVGITRARLRLRLSWAGPNRQASRFLADLR